MARPRIGVLVDNRRVARWQAEALRNIAGKYEVLVYSCANPRPSPRRLRHALYYLLNVATIRNRLTRQIALPAEMPVVGEVTFEAEYEGNWQILPEWVLSRVADDRVALLLRFGTGLLKVPDADRISVPILSYHHGDPRRFRGRPAGFYEILHDADCLGQVVQVLNNDLDAGPVAAFGESRIHRHSYRATLLEAFRTSPILLSRAIENVLAGRTTIMEKGKTYRLPSNGQVIALSARMLRNLIRRLLYGVFVEKCWRVAQTECSAGNPASLVSSFPAIDHWTVEPLPKGYSFIADPFFHPGGEGILVEGLAKSTGVGEIVHLDHGKVRRLTPGRGHWSYPATISVDGAHFVIPEASEVGSAKLFRLAGAALEPVEGFSIDGQPRLLDPTMVHHEGRFYLFANRLEEGAGVLRLWSGEELTGHFTEHSASPVRISPAGSRMAGNVVVAEKSLWRFGQDFARDYGDGVLLFEIQCLSSTEYREIERSRLKFADVHGPHTVNIDGSRVLFDYYQDAVSSLAGLRRLRAHMR